MANKRIQCQDSLDSQTQAELEFLEALLLADVCYPWNPADPESEVYLSGLEESLAFEEWSADEVRSRGQTLYAEMARLWAVTADSESPAHQKGAIASLQESLQQRFSAYVPADALNAIARQAHQLLSANLSVADRLVQCAHQLLSHWSEEDLHVLARPMAYAMRGTEPAAIESILAAVRPVAWTELSEIERARLTLAIAHYALTKLDTYAMG